MSTDEINRNGAEQPSHSDTRMLAPTGDSATESVLPFPVVGIGAPAGGAVASVA